MYSRTILQVLKTGTSVAIALLIRPIHARGMPGFVPIVKAGDHFLLEGPVEILAVEAILLLDRSGTLVCSDGEAVRAVVGLAPPPVQDAQVQAAVDS